ncbi:MAG: hypothetical protein ACOC1K_06975 [Nanoarchaeota archaeon]
MNKKIFLFCIIMFFVVVNLSCVFAIGITPGRTTINFKPGLSKDVSFSILNSEHKEMSVVFAIRGNMSEYISMDKNTVDFSSSEKSKSFSYKVNLPEDYNEFGGPGTHKAEVVALEIPKNMPKDLEGSPSLIATVAVITQVHIEVPYPNKYAEASVDVISSPDEVVFVIPVNNKGKLDIVDSYAEIEIYDSMNEQVASLKTDSKEIPALKRKDLSTKWDASNINPGEYFAKVTVFYDDEVINLEREFEVGQKALEVIEINIDNFRLGEIAKFEALVENKWSEDIENAYLNIIVYNNEEEVMTDFKSPTYNIPALSREKMISYWDTAGVHEGVYDGKLTLRYGDKVDERNIQLKITEDSIEVIGITGRVIVDDGSSGFNMTTILIIVIVMLVMINIIWFMVVRRLLEKRKK